MKLIKHASRFLCEFQDRYGFALLVILCVAVIAGSALWMRQNPVQPLPTTRPSPDGMNAAALLQQHLPDMTSAPLPTQTPPTWRAPLDEYHVLRGFCPSQMSPSGTTGLWAVHAGADLGAPEGTPVCAIADGVVRALGDGGLCGAWIEIEHAGHAVSRYAALSRSVTLHPGDPVRAGQVIGFVGNSHLEEAYLMPHLHLEVTIDGAAVDPIGLIQ